MATNQIEYQGYIATVEIDRIANLLRATVINIDTAVVSACGRTVAELEESLVELSLSISLMSDRTLQNLITMPNRA